MSSTKKRSTSKKSAAEAVAQESAEKASRKKSKSPLRQAAASDVSSQSIIDTKKRAKVTSSHVENVSI